ncbi:TIGR03943 family putative permease subunit [Clostridium hydrogenum]|uniref:TIGR03943 family putative permease subunit n=1 Tax=Clostridium hydrogenum TaxID=2855764 RepID=UPI001F372B9B|nr:TIGR03943 family protein [Clostridium hydrogenum]
MINKFKWFIFLIGFSYYMYYLISSKKLYLFIHPKMTNYIIFSMVVLFVLSLLELKKILFNKKHTTSVSIIFFVPLILAYIINPQGLNSNIAANKGITSNIYSTEKDVTSNKISNLITLTDSNFSDMTNEISYNLNKYKGKEITISGFVYKDEHFPKNTFAISRMLIVCCAADAEITGLACRIKGNVDLKNNEWISVTGTINSVENFDKNYSDQKIIPIIDVTSEKNISKPKNPYIYLKRT